MEARQHGKAGFVALLQSYCSLSRPGQLWALGRRAAAQVSSGGSGACPYEANCDTLSASSAPLSLLPPPSKSAP